MVRGHMMYGSPYRNYNRGGGGGGGFGRGQPRRFQPPPPPPPPPPQVRKADVFEEAGRLAAEYLVSKGLLPPDALSGKWQNGSFNKNQDYSFFKAQEGDNGLDNRTSAADIGSAGGRRRLVDDFDPKDKGRRRSGSFKDYGLDYGSEGNRELGRSGSWSEKARGSFNNEGGDSLHPDYMEEQRSDVGNEDQKLPSVNEVVPKLDDTGNLESEIEKSQVVGNAGLNVSSSLTSENDVAPDAAAVSTESGDGMVLSSAETAEAKDGSANVELEKLNASEDTTMIQQCVEEDDPGNSGGGDLLALSRFSKVPTKTRSSLASRGSKVNPVLIAEDDPDESEVAKESGVCVEDVCKDVSLGDASVNQNSSLKSNEPSEASDEQGARQLGLDYKPGQGQCTRSKSFPERSFMSEVRSSEGELGFGRSCSMNIERGEKRALHSHDSWEGTKRFREWNPSDSIAENFVHHSNSMEKLQTTHSHEGMPSIEEAILDADQQKMMDLSMYPNTGNDSCIEHAEEKQLFPGSFKICDLNLMESSDVHESHDNNPGLMLQSITQIKKEDPVDIDLSMSSSGNGNDKNGLRGADGKEVVLIDLESDTVQEDNAYNNAARKDENLFTDLESFPDQPQNVNEIPDGQDGYGLMISELLGADIPNCSPVRPDINPLHNEMGMHNGEGIPGDDDPIYMSLGEIPISFLHVWDQQPTQEYEKPF